MLRIPSGERRWRGSNRLECRAVIRLHENSEPEVLIGAEHEFVAADHRIESTGGEIGQLKYATVDVNKIDIGCSGPIRTEQ